MIFKVAMALVVALALTACATATPPPPPPTAGAPTAAAKACDWPAYMDQKERFAKGQMGGATAKIGMFNCGTQ